MSRAASIVMPVHNGGALLQEAIDSVLAQTFEDYSLTVVDNASTDGTPDVVAMYASRDERVTLLRFDRMVDANANHSRAFRLADPGSRYIKVLQGDDRLFPRCLERMIALADASPSVGVVSAYRISGEGVDLRGLRPNVQVISGTDALRQSLLGGPHFTGSPTSLLFRTDLVRARDPFYDPAFWSADTEAVYWAFTRADFGLVPEVLTYTRRQLGSRSDWATMVDTYAPENLRLLLRFGQRVLSRGEYRARLRLLLRHYATFHVVQRFAPTYDGDEQFRTFHRDEIERIREESHGDREVLAVTACISALLGRGPGR